MKENFSIRWFDTVDSTNTRLLEERGSLPGGTVYAARFQTSGKGQRGNRWESGRGENLTFSILLKPTRLPASMQFSVSEAVALGISDFLAGNGVESRIKWPNDIYCGDKKICGILIESALNGDILADCVIGIGLNLNQREFAPGIANPTSLLLETGRMIPPEDALPELLAATGARLEALPGEERANPALLEGEYLKRLYRIGQWHDYIDCRGCADRLTPTTEDIGGERFRGRITGITPAAELMVEDGTGAIRSFSFKELRYCL